ncbi:MAG: hypothetical protein AB8C84_11030 [Oligoflexales bacterium]
MAFVYMSHLAEEGQKKQNLANSIVMSQSFKGGKCSHMTLKLCEDFLKQANIHAGMHLEVGFDPEAKKWKVFTVHRGGYELKAAAGQKVILRWPHFEGMPLIAAVPCRLRADTVDVGTQEFTFSLEQNEHNDFLEEIAEPAESFRPRSKRLDVASEEEDQQEEYDPAMTLSDLAIKFDEYRVERNFNAGDRGVKYPKSLKRLASAKAASLGHRRVAHDLRLTEASVRRWMTQYPMVKQIVIRRKGMAADTGMLNA